MNSANQKQYQTKKVKPALKPISQIKTDDEQLQSNKKQKAKADRSSNKQADLENQSQY